MSLPRISAALALVALASAAPAQAGDIHFGFPKSVTVTVAQGGTTNFTVPVQVGVDAPCPTTTVVPAVIDSLYSVNSVGTIEAGVPIGIPVTANKPGPNCDPTSPVLVNLTVTAAASSLLGDYTTPLVINQRQGIHIDGPKPTTLIVHVVRAAPPAPVVIVEPVVPPTLEAPAAPTPTLGKTVLLTLVKGPVSFQERGGKVLPLVDPIIVPNGTKVFALDGVVKVTVAHDASGALDSVDAWGGSFVVNQVVQKGGLGLTTLTLLSTPATSQAARRVATAAKRRRHGNHLWVNGKGNFQTRGKRASAIVRGTYWLTEDTDAGTTKVAVQKGLVAVRDFSRHRTVLVSTGHNYTARPRTVRAHRVPAFTGSVRG